MIEQERIPLWSIDNLNGNRKDKLRAGQYYPPYKAEELDFNNPADEANAARGYVEGTSLTCPITDGKKAVWDMTGYTRFMGGTECPSTVNPVLWRMERLNNKNGLFQVLPQTEHGGRNGKVYQLRSYDLATMAFIKSDTGWIVIDPLTCAETSSEGWKMFREKVDARATVRAVIITHSHVDHYKGLDGIVSPDNILRNVRQADFERNEYAIPQRKVLVIAPNGFYEESLSENLYLGTCMSRRAVYMYGSGLPRDAKGHIGSGLGKTVSGGSGALRNPSFEVMQPKDTAYVTLYIDGLTVCLQDVPDTEAPAEFHVYIKDYSLLCPGENVTHTMHNLLTSRGAKVRDPKAFGKAIDRAMQLFSSVACIIGTHHWPTWGHDECFRLMEKQRDMYYYFNNQVIRMLNKGMNMEEIAESFTFTASLNGEFYNRGYYGTINHNVKAVVQRYIGWWDGNPANYFKYPEEQAAVRWVADMGGADAVLRRAIDYFNGGDYRWTVELTRCLVFSKAGNGKQARLLQADALEQLAYSFESGTWRNIFLSAATELRDGPIGNLPRLHMEFITQAAENIRTLPPEYIFEYLATLLKAEEVGDNELTLYIRFRNTEQTFELQLKNGVLHHREIPAGQTDPSALLFDNVDAFADDFKARMYAVHPDRKETAPINYNITGLTWLYANLDTFNGMWNIVEPLG